MKKTTRTQLNAEMADVMAEMNRFVNDLKRRSGIAAPQPARRRPRPKGRMKGRIK